MTLDHTGQPVPKSQEAAYRAAYDPNTLTPEQQAEREKIQAEWDEKQRRKKAGANNPKPWKAPTVTSPEFEQE